jgi:AcrR family transcriptional regulator
MGIRERQERDREAVRRAILDAARELFVVEGYSNVSIRKIAERIEYSPAAIYSYFPSKDDIFFDLAEEGFKLLHGEEGVACRPELADLEPLERVRAMFRRMYLFSRQHPQYFALMFLDRSVPRISREYDRFHFARNLKGDVVRRIQEAIDAGSLPATTNPAVAFRLLTLSLLGLASAHLSDRLSKGENPDDLALDLVNVVLAGLQSGVELHSTGWDESEAGGCLAFDESERAKVS